MKYDAVYEADARERFRKLSPLLASKVYDAIDVLCGNPTELSRPSHFPHPLHFQLHETHFEHDGVEFLLKVFFHYSQDERSLLIDDFVAMELR
jgi:hypothetical protein